jgi:3-oxoacyl-[acyl-carrier protein] reductase
MGRLGTPEEVAAAVTFLLCPGGAYLTGAILNVSGGLYM